MVSHVYLCGFVYGLFPGACDESEFFGLGGGDGGRRHIWGLGDEGFDGVKARVSVSNSVCFFKG